MWHVHCKWTFLSNPGYESSAGYDGHRLKEICQNMDSLCVGNKWSVDNCRIYESERVLFCTNRGLTHIPSGNAWFLLKRWYIMFNPFYETRWLKHVFLFYETSYIHLVGLTTFSCILNPLVAKGEFRLTTGPLVIYCKVNVYKPRALQQSEHLPQFNTLPMARWQHNYNHYILWHFGANTLWLAVEILDIWISEWKGSVVIKLVYQWLVF